MSKALSVAMSPHFRAGQDYERERIIGLLEEVANTHRERWKHVTHDIRDEGASDAIEAAIALIKKENK
jgi:hypothetical protein